MFNIKSLNGPQEHLHWAQGLWGTGGVISFLIVLATRNINFNYTKYSFILSCILLSAALLLQICLKCWVIFSYEMGLHSSPVLVARGQPGVGQRWNPGGTLWREPGPHDPGLYAEFWTLNGDHDVKPIQTRMLMRNQNRKKWVGMRF